MIAPKLNDSISEAVTRLKNGDVVAIPTETVYGLAGIISSERALKKIFAVKERPFFDPLIVHVSEAQDVLSVAASLSPLEKELLRHFWPGPLTLVLPRAQTLNPLITAGLEYVGVRCPNHPVALEILKQLGEPFAAPSANKFGKTSPTHAEHVREEFPELFVVDGGESVVGVESTVVQFNESNSQLEIFRPGAVTLEMLNDFLKKHNRAYSVVEKQSPVAPGQIKYHYQPPVPVILADTWPLPSSVQEELGHESIGSNTVFLDLGNEATTAARILYFEFRRLSQLGASAIVITRSSEQYGGVWSAVWNRVEKAATFTVKSGKVQKR